MNFNKEWRGVVGYEDCYMVSNKGNVKSKDRYVFNGKVNYFKEGRKISIAKSDTGYGIVSLYKNGKAKMFKVHRLVAMSFIENIEEKRFVNHKDGDKLNNFIENLEWVTHSENISHAYNKGLIFTNKIPVEVLSNMYVRDGKNISQISRELNISRDIVRDRLKKYNLYVGFKK